MTEQSITRGSGNVFADLGLPVLRVAKAVNDILATRQLRQADAARLLGIPQPRVSALVNYRLNEFSVEKLISLLTALEQDVHILIRPRAGTGVGEVSVETRR